MKQSFAFLIPFACVVFSLAAQETPAPAGEPAAASGEEPAPPAVSDEASANEPSKETAPEPIEPAPALPAPAPQPPADSERAETPPPPPAPEKPTTPAPSEMARSLTTYTISASAIRDAAPRTLADALFAVPGIAFREPGAALAYPLLRGMPSEAVPIIFANIPLSGTVFTGGTGAWLSLLDRRFGTETSISTVPATVATAAGATGGAIIVSPFTTDAVRGVNEFTPTGRFNTRFSSADTGRDAHARLAGGYGDFGAIAMGSVSFTDTRTNGARQEQPFSAYENYGAFFTGDWEVARTSGSRWHTSVGYLFAQGSNTADTSTFTDDLPAVHFYDRSAHLAWGRLAMALPASGIEGTFTVLYQNSSENTDTLRSSTPFLVRRTDDRDELMGHTIGIQTDFVAHIIPERFDLFYGALYSHDLITARRYTSLDTASGLVESGVPILSDGASSDRTTGYVRGTYELLPPMGSHRVLTTLGYRFDALTLRAPEREEIPAVKNTDPGHGIEAGILYRWRENFGTALTYGHGTRAATLREAASYGMRNGLFLVPNGGLDPETSDTLSLTLSGKTKRISALLCGFVTYLDHRIALAPALWNGLSTKDGYPVAAYQNSDRSLIWGISAEQRLSLPIGLSITGGATYLWGEEKHEGTVVFLETIPPLLWRIVVRWDSEETAEYRGFAELALRGSTDTRAEKRTIVTDPSFDAAHGGPWQTVTLRGGFVFEDYIHVILALENLLDRQYRPVLSSIDGPGIQAVLSLDAEF